MAEDARAWVAEDRAVLAIGGADRERFLQDLLTNDIGPRAGALVYAALLTPQGKYLFDLFLTEGEGVILVDVAEARAAALIQRLTLYRLRADVTLQPAPLRVVQALDAPLPGALPDPRHPALGWRLFTAEPAAVLTGRRAPGDGDWTALRVAHAVPETGIELLPEESYILEAGFDRLNGVDFTKGCYVGQEVTARMRHKTTLKKGLVRVSVEGPPPPPGTPVEAEGKPAGTLFSVAAGAGLAHLRFDRAGGAMTSGAARLRALDS